VSIDSVSLPKNGDKKGSLTFCVGNPDCGEEVDGGCPPPNPHYDELRRPKAGHPRGGSGYVIADEFIVYLFDLK